MEIKLLLINKHLNKKLMIKNSKLMMFLLWMYLLAVVMEKLNKYILFLYFRLKLELMFTKDLLIEAIILKLNKVDNFLTMYLEDILLSVSV
jgi:hypothetical protein